MFTSRSTDRTTEFDDANRHYVHYWQTTDGQWHEQYVDDASVDLSNAGIEPTRSGAFLLDRGDLLFDGDDALHVYAVVDETLYAAVATASSGWGDWTVYVLHEGPITGSDGRKHDERRWANDGVLSIPLERPDGDGGTEFVLHDYALEPTTAPAAPTLSVASTSSGVELDWTPARGASSYAIHRRSSSGSFEKVATGVAANSFYTRYTVEDVASDADDEYRVEAVNAAGGTLSNTVSASTVRE